MTIHAGEKAARLRRAAASSSALASTVNNIGNSTTFSPIDGTSDNIESPLLSPSPIADADVLGIQPLPVESVEPAPIPLVYSRRSTGSCKKNHHHHHHPSQSHQQANKQPCHRHKYGQKQLHSASCTSLQSMSGHFVFSGVNLAPSQCSETTPVDWDTFDVHNPASTAESSQTYYQPTLVFVPQLYEKEAGDTSTTVQEDTSIASNETILSSNKTKSSPRRFLPSWLLTLSPSPSNFPAVPESDEKFSSNDDVQANDSNNEETKKSSKKKRKKKKKGKGKINSTKAEEDETEEIDEGDDANGASEGCSREICSPNISDLLELQFENGERASYQKKGYFASEGESQEETVKHSDQSFLPSEFDGTSDALQGDQEDVLNSQSMAFSSASSSCLPSSQQFQLAKSKRKRKAIQRRESQAREMERVKVENEKKDKAPQQFQVTKIHKLEASHNRAASGMETETSHHTANLDEASAAQLLTLLHVNLNQVDGSINLQDQKEQLNAESTASSLLLNGTSDKPGTSTVSSTTGYGSVSTDGERGSSHSSPTLDVQAVNQFKGLTDSKPPDWSQNESESQISSLSETSIKAEIPLLFSTNLEHPNLKVDTTLVSEVKERSETEEGILERHQRTLNWRLVSAGSSSPTSQPSKQDQQSPPQLSLHIPVVPTTLSRRASQQSDVSVSSPSRSQLALQLRRHQQRRLNYAWVHSLPTFEDLHPRDAQERETQLRRLAWLGLEEYVARKVKACTRDGASDTVAWITHSYYGRSATPYRTKASHFEPLLCSSPFWSRSPKVLADEYTKPASNKAQDAIGNYRSKLLQERYPTTASLTLNNTTFPTETTQDSHEMEWLSSPQSEISHCYPILNSTQTLDSSHQFNTIKITNQNSSDIDREECLELQKQMETCMYELRCTNVSIGADVAWLETLNSIGQEEKNSIEAFFHDYTPDWYTSPEGNTAVADNNCLQPGPNEVWPYASEMVWPTTPYTPLGLTLGPTNEQNNEVENSSNNIGLSSCEMLEIEDAMYRDYLFQTNQSSYSRSKKKERNYYGQGRNGGDSNQGIRSRASSAFTKTPTIVDAQGKLRLSTSPMRTRSQEGRQSNTNRLRLQHADAEFRITGDTMSKFGVPSIPTLEKPCNSFMNTEGYFQAKDEVIVNEDSKNEVVEGKEIKEESNLSCVHDTKRQEEQEVCEAWAKNNVVRHSLASLQQHLCLVASQKQTQNVLPKDEMTSPPSGIASNKIAYGNKHQQQSLPFPPTFHQQAPRGYKSWPLPGDPNSMINVAALQTQRSLQTELKKQQITQEARQLEQRHLDSHAQAMARSSSHSYPNNANFNERQSQDVARLQAALLSEWARHGGSENNYFDPRYPGLTSQFASPIHNAPAITLTKPAAAPVKKPPQIKFADDRIHQRAAWSDEPNLSLEEALHQQQGQGPWQATILQTAATMPPIRRSSWSQDVEVESNHSGAQNLRRGSVQSAPSHCTEFGLPLNYVSDSIASTSSLRPEVFTPTKSRRVQSSHSSGGSKRRGKQKEASLQSTLDHFQSQPSARLPLTPMNGDQHRRIAEQQQQQQQNPTALANQTSVHPLLHSYDEGLIRRNSTTSSSQQNGTGGHSRKQKRW